MKLLQWFGNRARCMMFSLFPCYRGTGGKVLLVASDWRHVRVRIPLSWRTRNYVGTIFGGSMAGATDPIYMLMLIRNLGRDYEVWDKAATIRFKRPGRSELFAEFRVTPEELDSIREELRHAPKLERTYRVELRDADGTVCAEVDRLIHIRRHIRQHARELS